MHIFRYGCMALALGVFLISCNGKKETPAEESRELSTYEKLNERIRSEPNNPVLYYERSQWNMAEKKPAPAEDDIRKAISLDSTKPEYYMQLANATFANLRIGDAEGAFKKVITMNPDHKEGRLKLAELYLYLRRYDLSLEQANEALRIDKHLAKAYFIKGFVYKENKDTAKAISSFETAIEQEPTYYESFVQLGLLYGAHHDPLAIQYYNSALKLQPHSTEVLYNRGLFYQEHGELEKAISDYNELLKADPRHANAWFNLGYIELKYRKDYKKAVEYFTGAIKNETYYAEALYNRGVAYENLGDREKARADYKEVLSTVPDYKLAKDALKRIGK